MDLNDFDVRKTEVVTTWQVLLDTFKELYIFAKSNPDFCQTVVIDSGDWVERLMQNHLCDIANVETMAADVFSYGRGKKAIIPLWDALILRLDSLRDIGIHVVVLAHEKHQKITPPDAASYEKTVPAIDDGGREMLCEWADEIFRLSFTVQCRTEDEGFNRTRTVVSKMTEGKRECQTSPSAGVLAKNRLGLESVYSGFSWGVYQEAINNR